MFWKYKLLFVWPERDDYRADLMQSEIHDRMLTRAFKNVARTLKFRPEYQEAAQTKLLKAKAKMEKRFPEEVKQGLSFVGVHNRRTDYTKYTDDKFQMHELDETYFDVKYER